MAKTKVELQNYQGESLSPITIASNVLYEDGRNAQEVFEEYSNETFTPTIENSGSMFKVGQGDNVDYSSNVVNGAYESMVLKGKTMVNCIQEPSSKDVVLPYEFADGQYVTINDTKESGALGIELKGQTLVNAKGEQISLENTWATDKQLYECLIPAVKANTNYYIKYELNSTSDSVAIGFLIDGGTWSNNQESLSSVSGSLILNSGSQPKYFRIVGNANTITTVNHLMIIEYQEGMENWDIPYFEGMTSCKMPILHTVGKNLLYKHNDVGNTYGISQFHDGGFTTGEMGSYATFGCIRSLNNPTQTQLDKNPTSVQKGKTYTISCEVKKMSGTSAKLNYLKFTGYNNAGDNYSWTNIGWNSAELNYDYNNTVKLSKTIECDCSYKHIVFAGQVSSDSSSAVYKITNIQLEESSSSTTYEDHKSSILSLPEEVVLRRVGEIGDTLNCMTGEFVKRIEEFILDGGENWSVIEKESYNSFRLKLSKGYAKYENSSCLGLCDKFPFISHQSTLGKCETTGIGIYHHSDTNYEIILNVLKTEFSDVSSLRQYLQTNPVTVQYQLETPVITKINLPSTLKSWNTTTHIYSEIPENTLYPTLSHSNPTYPVILKPSTKYSIVANSYSNDHTNSVINFNLGGATASTTVGNRVTTITTPSTLSNELLTMSGRGNKLNNVMVIEGDVVGDEPYFEGMCDCKSPILSNVGKNLFDERKVILNKYQNHNTSNGNFSISTNTNYKITDFIRVKPNTKYDNQIGNGAYYNIDKKPLTNHSCGISIITTPSDAHYVVLNMRINEDTSTGYFIEAPQRVTHEPYKSNITTFDQKDSKTIVLRSLPNGVCDTLNVETGEYVQRIGEVVKNNSTGFRLSTGGWENKTKVCTFEHFKPEGMKVQLANNKLTLNCDKIPSNTFSTQWNNSEGVESITQHNGGHIVLSITREKLSTQDVNGLNTYLQSNPITVQYELATPIVSTIDVQGFPYAYTSGHVQLSSGSIEQSLTPKVEYSVATNRNGQIRTNQKMVERHQKQLDQLQAIILANMVNTQYQQTLTTLNYDLLKKEVGE